MRTVSAGNARRDDNAVTGFAFGNHAAYFFNNTNPFVANNKPVIGVKRNFSGYKMDVAAADRGSQYFDYDVCRLL
jgi:hypothetical protein